MLFVRKKKKWTLTIGKCSRTTYRRAGESGKDFGQFYFQNNSCLKRRYDKPIVFLGSQIYIASFGTTFDSKSQDTQL